MRNGISKTLRISTLLVVAGGFFSLTTTHAFPVAVLLIPVVLFLLMPFAERLDLRRRWYRKLTLYVTVVYMVAIPIMFMALGLLGTVVTLVIYIIGFALLHQKSEREYQYLYLMSFFLLLASCMLSPEPSIALVLVLFLVSFVVAMVMLQLEVEALRHQGAAPGGILGLNQPDAVAHSPSLRDGGFPVVVAALAFITISITAFLFVATPRIEAGFLGRAEPAMMRVGRSQQVDLAQGGTILRDQTPIMQVSFPDEPGGQYDGPLFWRCTSLPKYNSPQWSRRNLSPTPRDETFALSGRRVDHTAAHSPAGNRLRDRPIVHQRRNPGPTPRDETLALSGRRVDHTTAPDSLSRNRFRDRPTVRQIIYMNDVPLDGAPALPLIQQFSIVEGGRDALLSWDTNGDFTVLLSKRNPRWLRYEVTSEVEEFSARTLRSAPDNYKNTLSRRDYELLTETDFSPETKRLVDSVVRDRITVYDKVVTVMDFLGSGQFRYSRTVPALPEQNAVETFITVTKLGHCQLFASAMALMLRSEGIPARVVSGYRGGEWSDADGAYIVRAEMAHMWVEVYFIGIGWVTFDPSPPDEVNANAISAFRRMLSRYILKAKMAWYSDVVSFDRRRQTGALRNLTGGFISFTTDLFEQMENLGGATPVSLIFLIIAVLAAAGAIVLAGRRPQTGLTPDQMRAVRLYRALLSRLERLGVNSGNKTAGEILTALALFPYLKPQAAEIVEQYNASRFGLKEMSPEKYRQLRALLKKMNLSR